ncbi:MAG: FAD-dependent monooxygenase, partial [Caulobacterales bacterium]|nr:FAD-dependent monooxygenase [Caulobacterales bacterium]
MSRQLDVLIAGAGIGGLTAAACLAQAGHRVRVFEQAPQLGEIGAGIQMSANGVRVMRAIGTADRLAEVGVKPAAYVFRIAENGEEVNRFPLADAHEAANGAPYYQLHRADLHSILADRARELAPDGVVLNAHVSGYRQTADRIELTLDDGSRVEGDVLIGADGIKSAVRAQMHGPAPADFTGDVAWRFMIPAANLPKDHVDGVMTVWLGRDFHSVVYYVRRKELVNVVAIAERDNWRDESWTSRRDWSDLKADFASATDEFQVLLDAADKDACYCWALFNRKPIHDWSDGRAALLGDAVHPTLPYLAQGAVMAIEDAAVLTRCLDAEADVAHALKRYAATRADRTARIV